MEKFESLIKAALGLGVSIQLGKNEGMFTFDRSLNEYLLYQKPLNSPAKSFQPSLESSDEIVYRSPVMNVLKEPSKGYFAGKKRTADLPLSSPAEEEPSTFSPDGKTLKDFIEELDKRYK